MTAAKTIKFPAPTVPQEQQPAKPASFTRLDNATDLEVLADLPNALLKPALCLLKHRHMRPVHWGEVATFSRRGATQTREALSRLADLGLAAQQGDLWSWADSPAARKPVRESARKPVRKSEFSTLAEAVQHGESPTPKEGTEGKKKEDTTNTYVSDLYGAATPGTGVVAGGSIAETAPQAPNGAAPGGARAETPSPSQEQTAHQHEETEDVTDSETVPPAAAPLGYRAAQDALSNAGAWDVWANWLRGNPALSRNRAAQDAQIAQFAEWVRGGLIEELRQHAREIVVAGSFAHPYLALEARMDRAKVVQDAKQQNVDETRRAFGEPTCTPGERRRAPDGQTWTVEEVAYGLVIFEEAAAPLDVPDAVVAEWAVVS
ncbi:hypothetical protein L1280_002809 [Deinococcus sp. HSC-46F16]|uniref:hypothetical protein n=1 Tax=Deinococcus sp. HSC-46F16 TaxID=2910968 RepID=UPI00209D63C3|nr:hypothetical protein [Deinococcus sp. HSC-46F16]MCP2015641.1 hypothetical protein [Deinococcus sp. HSC-46F16]